MKIKDLLDKGKPTFSFEFFPPKSEEAEVSLYKALERLKLLRPDFMTVTCGAMGTTQEKTADIVVDIKKKLGTESMAHVTCVAYDRKGIEELLTDLKKRGVENVLALRGDPSKGAENFEKPQNGFKYAVELVEYIRGKFGNDFSVGVAAYPETHVECKDPKQDLINLKAKVDAGGDFIITQLFFINENFFRFREEARRIGIQAPIIPGIMPLTNVKQLEIFGGQCGVQIPEGLTKKVRALGDDKQALEALGVEVATRQCDELLKEGVDGIHFYTLNRSKATRQIFENLNLANSPHNG